MAVTVSPSGLVTAVSPGISTIAAAHQGVSSTTQVTVPAPPPPGNGLRDIPAPFPIGCATVNNFWTLADAVQYKAVAAREFNILTPANQMKWSHVHPTQATYTFANADQHVQFAQANNMKAHGHTLLWHTSNPAWLTNPTVPWTKATLTAVMNGHIDNVVGHFRGKVAIWDVVNEHFTTEGRAFIWNQIIGPEYIELAFRRARLADPAVRLIYNDYDVETVSVKSTAMYNMAVDFKARGVPINGVGLQMHISTNGIDYASFANNMQRFANLGLEVYITEMTVVIAGAGTLATQAEVYRQVMLRCLAQPACKGFQTWGFTDKYGYIPTLKAQILDANYNKKPAYFALQTALAS